MGLTVKVNFPDGTREVPAHIHMTDRDHLTTGIGFRDVLGRVTPNDMDGWEFHAIIGGRDFDWIASPARPSYRDYAFDRNGLCSNEDYDYRPWEHADHFVSDRHSN